MFLLTNTPQRLWDNVLEYEAYVRSHTAHDRFKLDRRYLKPSCLARLPTLVIFASSDGMNG